MKKDMHHKHDKHNKKKHHRGDLETESVEDEMLHCDGDLTVLKLEFILVRYQGYDGMNVTRGKRQKVVIAMMM